MATVGLSKKHNYPMKKLIFTLLAAALLAPAAAQTAIAAGKVTITGQVINRSESSPQVVTANFQNPFNDSGDSPAAPVDPADGTFRFEYTMPYGQSTNIRYGNQFITFFAAPGDHIHLTVDASKINGKDVGQMVRFGGDKAELNTRFTAAYNYLTGMNRDFFDNKLPPEELAAAVGDRLQLGRDSLAAYARREKLPAKVVQLIDSEIVCGVLYYAALYRRGEPLREIMNRIFTEVVDIFDSRYTTSSMYSVDLGWYAQRGMMDVSLMEEGVEAFLKDCLPKIQDKPAGPARDILTYSLLAGLNQELPGTIEKFPEASALLDSEYARQLYAQLTDEEKKTPEFKHKPIAGISRITPELKSEPLPQVDIFEYLAEKHPGKVVYIDLSASWCGPCIAEFPHAKKLEESLAGEDVVFVILWGGDSVFDRTTDLIRKHELHAENYFFSSDASRLFSSAYDLNFFPTYLLMDKTGKLVDANASRPSDPKTEGRIRELLR
jgi:thiol-disulfide isomerase/thioredoxin